MRSREYLSILHVNNENYEWKCENFQSKNMKRHL